MTYSIGFRAPTATSALESFVLECEGLGVTERYHDADLELDRHHAEITDQEVERLRTMAARLLEQSPDLWRNAVGKMLSDSAVATSDMDEDQPVYLSDLQTCSWIRHPETRLLYHQSDGVIEVYYNGRVHALHGDREVVDQLQKLCENREWSVELISESIKFEALGDLLIELATNHAVLPIHE